MNFFLTPFIGSPVLSRVQTPFQRNATTFFTRGRVRVDDIVSCFWIGCGIVIIRSNENSNFNGYPKDKKKGMVFFVFSFLCESI